MHVVVSDAPLHSTCGHSLLIVKSYHYHINCQFLCACNSITSLEELCHMKLFCYGHTQIILKTCPFKINNHHHNNYLCYNKQLRLSFDETVILIPKLGILNRIHQYIMLLPNCETT